MFFFGDSEINNLGCAWTYTIFKREQPIRLTLLKITFVVVVVFVFCDLSNLYYKRLDKDVELS